MYEQDHSELCNPLRYVNKQYNLAPPRRLYKESNIKTFSSFFSNFVCAVNFVSEVEGVLIQWALPTPVYWIISTLIALHKLKTSDEGCVVLKSSAESKVK